MDECDGWTGAGVATDHDAHLGEVILAGLGG